jgi:hypothetical protein
MRIKSRALNNYKISVRSVPCKLSGINGLDLYIPYILRPLGHFGGKIKSNTLWLAYSWHYIRNFFSRLRDGSEGKCEKLTFHNSLIDMLTP